MKVLILLFIFSFKISALICFTDLTVIGGMKYADGLSSISYAIVDMLKDDLSINVLPMTVPCLNESLHIKKILENSRKETPSKILIFTNLLWAAGHDHTKDFISENSENYDIKIAYSMLEADRIPKQWVTILNTKFDAVVVPDKWLIEVYQKSGVYIPIFVLPVPTYLKEFLSGSSNKNKNEIFTFGTSAGFGPDKNHELLLKAFIKEFKNEKNVRLIIHGRGAHGNQTLKNVKNIIKQNKMNERISLLDFEMLRLDYVKFIKSLNCFVLLSRGEGFSITPREAMAGGVPCILSKNSAHLKLCRTGLCEAVEAPIITKADYNIFFGDFEAQKRSCRMKDACKALRAVYSNYPHYLKLAEKAKIWVEKYLPCNLKKYFLTLVRPNRVILCRENKILEGCIKTDSVLLYNKYLLLNRPRPINFQGLTEWAQ